MNETAVIKARERTGLSKSDGKALKNQGYLFGNISRKGMDSISIAVRNDVLRKSLNQHGRNGVFNIELSDDKNFTVMVKDIQITPVKNEYHHVDFQLVSLTQEVKSDVPIEFIGIHLLESKKFLLNRQIDFIPVKGFPQDIPEDFKIDLSNMKPGDVVKVGDIEYPKGITTEIESDKIIITISESKIYAEEETETVAETV